MFGGGEWGVVWVGGGEEVAAAGEVVEGERGGRGEGREDGALWVGEGEKGVEMGGEEGTAVGFCDCDWEWSGCFLVRLPPPLLLLLLLVVLVHFCLLLLLHLLFLLHHHHHSLPLLHSYLHEQ